MPDMVEIFTDGACSGNPGPGGWAALLRYKGVEKSICGAETHTTNNRMELTAAIMALESLKRQCKVIIFTDSQYLKLGITQWIENWKMRDWKTAQKTAVKNQDLWQRLDKAVSRHHVTWKWIQAHNNHAENDMVDALAKQAMEGRTCRKPRPSS